MKSKIPKIKQAIKCKLGYHMRDSRDNFKKCTSCGATFGFPVFENPPPPPPVSECPKRDKYDLTFNDFIWTNEERCLELDSFTDTAKELGISKDDYIIYLLIKVHRKLTDLRNNLE